MLDTIPAQPAASLSNDSKPKPPSARLPLNEERLTGNDRLAIMRTHVTEALAVAEAGLIEDARKAEPAASFERLANTWTASPRYLYRILSTSTDYVISCDAMASRRLQNPSTRCQTSLVGNLLTYSEEPPVEEPGGEESSTAESSTESLPMAIQAGFTLAVRLSGYLPSTRVHGAPAPPGDLAINSQVLQPQVNLTPTRSNARNIYECQSHDE